MINRTAWSSLYILFLILGAAIGLTYPAIGDGLGSSWPGGVFRCRELQSSGSDDDIVLAFSVILIFPALLRLININMFFTRMEVSFLFLTLVVLFLAFTFLPECGNIVMDLFLGGDFLLISLFVCILFAILVYVRKLSPA